MPQMSLAGRAADQIHHIMCALADASMPPSSHTTPPEKDEEEDEMKMKRQAVCWHQGTWRRECQLCP